MIDITDKITLEGVFAKDFNSQYYPILANLYLQEGDLRRAKKVCEIGLDNDSSNVDGKFILAKVALAENKKVIAEKWLKQVIVENPAHFIKSHRCCRKSNHQACIGCQARGCSNQHHHRRVSTN